MFGSKIHRFLYFLALTGITVGLPLNKIVLSLSGLLLAVNWILEGHYKKKILLFTKNKVAVLLFLIFFLHIFGLIWTTDFEYALRDIRIKLPLLLFPVVIPGIEGLNKKRINYLLFIFTVVVTLLSFINWVVFRGGETGSHTELRDLSLFVSHIRFGLMVVFASFVALVLAFSGFAKEGWKKALLFPIGIWLLYYTWYSQVLSGFLAIGLLVVTLLFWFLSKNDSGTKRIVGMIIYPLIIVSATTLVVFAVLPEKKTRPVPADLEYTTPLGNTYTHILESDLTENGNLVFYYICKKELRQHWSEYSSVPIDSLDAKGNKIYGTLIRYMASKGLRKDATDLKKLSKEDIRYIEQGVASVVYTYGGLRSRLAIVSLELQKYWDGGDPNGSTVLERLEYWETGWDIIGDHPLLGVGTGDIQNTFQQYYNVRETRLLPENRHRTHQQFLTMWVTFGIPGIVLFLILHIVFLVQVWKANLINSFIFGIVVVSSYLTEDTLETQTGATFVAFFLIVLSAGVLKKENNGDSICYGKQK